MTQERYVIVFKNLTTDGRCKSCDFEGMKILECANVSDMKNQWLKAVAKGYLVEVFKRVYVNLEVEE